MSNPDETIHIDDPSEAQQTSLRLNEYKQEIIQERWLSTLILSIHLELEACLEMILASSSPPPNIHSPKKQRASFSTKLFRCASLNLLEPSVIIAAKAINKLRNELAHRLDNKPTNESLFRFIESMSTMHLLSVTSRPTQATKELRTFAAIKAHFSDEENVNLEEFVFISIMLLRATLLVRVKTVMAISSNA